MKGKRLPERGFINLQSQENGVLFPCSTFPCSPQGKIPIDKITTVCQEKITYFVDQVKRSIAPVPKRAHRQVSLTYYSPAHPPHPSPSFPTRPGLSIQINSHLEGSIMAKNHVRRQSGRKLPQKTNQRRRTFFAQHLATSAG